MAHINNVLLFRTYIQAAPTEMEPLTYLNLRVSHVFGSLESSTIVINTGIRIFPLHETNLQTVANNAPVAGFQGHNMFLDCHLTFAEHLHSKNGSSPAAAFTWTAVVILYSDDRMAGEMTEASDLFRSYVVNLGVDVWQRVAYLECIVNFSLIVLVLLVSVVSTFVFKPGKAVPRVMMYFKVSILVSISFLIYYHYDTLASAYYIIFSPRHKISTKFFMSWLRDLVLPLIITWLHRTLMI